MTYERQNHGKWMHAIQSASEDHACFGNAVLAYPRVAAALFSTHDCSFKQEAGNRGQIIPAR
jgi:hypothetical protein